MLGKRLECLQAVRCALYIRPGVYISNLFGHDLNIDSTHRLVIAAERVAAVLSSVAVLSDISVRSPQKKVFLL